MHQIFYLHYKQSQSFIGEQTCDSNSLSGGNSIKALYSHQIQRLSWSISSAHEDIFKNIKTNKLTAKYKIIVHFTTSLSILLKLGGNCEASERWCLKIVEIKNSQQNSVGNADWIPIVAAWSGNSFKLGTASCSGIASNTELPNWESLRNCSKRL